MRRIVPILACAVLVAGCSVLGQPAGGIPTGSEPASGAAPGEVPGGQPSSSGAVASEGAPEVAGEPLPHLVQMAFADSRHGWAVARDDILRTSDGGETWVRVTPGEPGSHSEYGSWSGAFPSADEAWIAYADPPEDGGITVYHTTDGGAHWSATPVDVHASFVQLALLPDGAPGFILAHTGAATGNEAVVVIGTADGGESWRTTYDARDADHDRSHVFSGHKTGIAFADAGHGWLSGGWPADSILLYRTEDGGRTWTRQEPPVPEGLSADGGAAESEAPTFFDAGHGVLPVLFSGGAHTLVLYRTDDGGDTWTAGAPLELSSTQWLPGLAVLGADRILAVDQEHVHVTTDLGRTWQEEGSTTGVPGLVLAAFASPDTGWATSGDDEERNDRLYRTRDGGKTWEAVDAVVLPGAGTP